MTDEEDLIGEPLPEVPQREPTDVCNGRRKKSEDGELVEDDEGRKIFAGYCQLVSGWGTDSDHGRCRKHGGSGGSGGSREGAGANEGNDNAATHELYSSENTYYQRRDPAQQAIIDAIYEDYHERFVNRHGKPATGDEAMLFKVAVSIHKLLKADDWEEVRPDSLDSEHPLVDRSEKRTAQGESYYEYKRSAVMQAEKQLEGFVRRWLKDNDLLGAADDGADVEVNISAKMWDDLTGYYDED